MQRSWDKRATVLSTCISVSLFPLFIIHSMPPFLGHGKATQQRRVVFPPLLVLCRCSECITTPFFDQATNQICFGQFVTEVQHCKHIWEDLQKGVAAQNYAAETQNHAYERVVATTYIIQTLTYQGLSRQCTHR